MSGASKLETEQTVAGFAGGVEGVTPPLKRDRRGSFLSDVIIELGFADQDVVEEAVQASRQPGRRMGDILLEGEALSEEELARAVAERNGLDYVDLSVFDVDLAAAGLIDHSSARRYGAVPIAFALGGALIVVLEDPLDAIALSDLEVMTRNEVRVAVAKPTAIRELIDRLPASGSSRAAPAPEIHSVPEAGQPGPGAAPGASSLIGELARELSVLAASAARAEQLAREAERRIAELES